MLAKLRGFMATEVFKYLFFGILATLVYMVSRTLIFQLTKQGTLSAVLANAIAIIFAFFTNSSSTSSAVSIIVFNQETAGMATRFVKFVGARLLTLVLDLALAYFLVDTYPEIIGQFVGHSQAWVNGIESLFAQVLIIVLNYIISKFFVFTDEKV